MSEFSLLYDVAKVRQIELADEVENARSYRILRQNRKNTSILKKLRTYVKSKS